MSTDYEYINCPRCSASLEVTYSVSVNVDTVSINHRDPINNYKNNIHECPAYGIDKTCIPYTGDLVDFYEPTVHEVEEWWLNGKVLFRGRPLSHMPLDESSFSLNSSHIEEMLSRVPFGETLPCAPTHADSIVVLMEWDGGSALTRRSPVDICTLLWPDGAWRVRPTTDGDKKYCRFAYFVGEKLMCMQMSIEVPS